MHAITHSTPSCWKLQLCFCGLAGSRVGCFHCLGVLFLQVEWSCPPALYEVQRASVPHDGRLVPDTFKASCKVSRPALGRVVCKKGLQDLANVYMRLCWMDGLACPGAYGPAYSWPPWILMFLSTGLQKSFPVGPHPAGL